MLARPPPVEEGAADGEPCTPWANGVTPCAEGLQCVATWDNQRADFNPPICYPNDMMFTTSQHDLACQDNRDCADTFWCNLEATPPSCETMLRSEPEPTSCTTARDCPSDAGEDCGYECIDGACQMWVR